MGGAPGADGFALEHGGVKKGDQRDMPKSAKKGTKKKSVPILCIKALNTMSKFFRCLLNRKEKPPTPAQVKIYNNNYYYSTFSPPF